MHNEALARDWLIPTPATTPTNMPASAALYQMLGILKLSQLPFVTPPSQPQLYEPLKAVDEDQLQEEPFPPLGNQAPPSKRNRTCLVIMVVVGLTALLGIVTLTRASYLEHRAATSSSASATVPQYFQTSPEIYAGECITHYRQISITL